MYYFLQKHRLLIVLLLLSLVSHWYIFFDGQDLNAGDWVYHFFSTLGDLKDYHIYASAYELGTVSVFANNWIFYCFYYFFSLLNIGWDIGTRILFLIPIIFLTPLFSFLLFKKIFQNNLIAFFGASIYSFNTFFLKLQLDWLTYAFLWWILPALFLSIINYLETKRSKYLIYNVILVFLGIAYELRIMILVLIYLSLFQIVYLIVGNEKIKEKLKKSIYIFLSFFIGILGHIFWILPMMKGNIMSDVMKNASPTPFVSFYDILDVFTLHMYSWSHNFVLEAFIKQPIETRHFLIPLLAIIGVLVYKKVQPRMESGIYFVFFAISLVIFIFLGKQELVPFAGSYGWAFQNIPLFNLYRESSKFFILVALSISFFFSIGLHWFFIFLQKYNRKVAIFIVGGILCASSIFNLQHFVDQRVGGMTKGSPIPNDYNIFEKQLSINKNFFRVLWIPTKPRFGFYSQEHPFVNAIDLPNIYNDLISSAPLGSNFPVSNQITDILGQKFSDRLFDEASVKYIVVPIVEQRERKTSFDKMKLVEEMYEYYGNREFFIDELDKLSYLKKIDIGTEELVVYENENYRPHIYVTQDKETIKKDILFEKVDFVFKNPTEYSINLKNISKPLYLNFSEKYHPDWKVRAWEFHWFDVLTQKDYFLPESFHFENDAKLSSFFIDPEYIRKNFTKDQYHENSDGSINLELTLYFKPQSYFYLGLIISGTTLVICLGYLGYVGIRSWRRKSLK